MQLSRPLADPRSRALESQGLVTWDLVVYPTSVAQDALPQELAHRRQIEDQLISLGAEMEQLAQRDSWNRERIRRLVGPAREAGITVRDISRLAGLSTQTLHTWMKDLMRPIPAIHFGISGPTPLSLDEAVLRTMGIDSRRDWKAEGVHAAIPTGWPTGQVEEIAGTLEQLARGHMIWDGEHGFRVAPPDDFA